MLFCRSGTQQCAKRLQTLSTRTEATKPAEYYEGRLEGTVPHHDCYIFLHASEPPTVFPSVHKTSVSLEMQRRASNWGGLVNFSWFGDAQKAAMSLRKGSQPATVFSRTGGKLEIPHVSLENMDQVEQLIQAHLSSASKEATLQDMDMHIYVCTHGARDCRCGERGKQVFNALVEVVERQQKTNTPSLARNIKVGEVGHVGGHKYAANLLVYPQGEWLGSVKPEDAPSIIAQACKVLEKGIKPLEASSPPTFISHWRGRMGLSKEEQKYLWAKTTGVDSPEIASKKEELRPLARA